MTPPDPEQLMRQALTGERAVDDPALHAALAANPARRAHYNALHGLASMLDQEGAAHRAAQGAPPAAGMPVFDVQAIRARLRTRRLRLVACAVAAILLCSVVLWWAAHSSRPAAIDSNYQLANVWQLTPARDCAVLPAVFVWHNPVGALSLDQNYCLLLRDEDSGETATIVLDREPRWTPTAAELRRIPRTFTWQVEVRGSGGLAERKSNVVRITVG